MVISERVARLLIRQWPALVFLVVVATAGAGVCVARLEFDLAFRHFFLRTAEDPVADAFRSRFGDDAGSYLVAILQTDDVLREDVLAAIVEMSDAVASIEHVRRVSSIGTVPYIRGRGTELSFASIPALVADGVDPSALREELGKSPLYSRRLVSVDGKTTALLALLDPDHRSISARAPTIARFREAVTARLPARTKVHFTGYPVTEAEYARIVLVGFGTAQVVGLGLMAIALYLTFRTITAVVLPLLSTSVATVLVLSLMQLTGQRLTFTNASVPLMMLVIGVAEVSYLVARFYEEALSGWDDDSPARAFASALWPGFIAACTTSAGFLALGAGHIGLTRDFGFNMGAAGLVTYGVAALLIPGALTRRGRPPERAVRAIEAGKITRWISRVTDAALARPWSVVTGSLLLVLFGALGTPRITLDQYATRELSREHPIREAQAVADESLSGTFQTNVVVAAPDGGVMMTPERLRAIEALQGFLTRQPGVVKTWSVVDYLKELHFALHGGSDRSIPSSEQLIAQYLFLLSSGGTTSDLPTVIDSKHLHANIILGTTDIGTDRLRTLRRDADAYVRDELGGVLTVRFVGDYWEIARGNEILAWDQMVSTLWAFLLILPFVSLLMRSWRLTVLCLPPNVIPLLASLGLMGFAHFDLRTGTSIILPVTLGVAIDTTTHLIARAREEWLRDGSYEAAVRRAILGTGWGMTSSTIALVAGFLAYQVPPFQTFKDVGILASWTLIVALVSNLFLTPLLIVVFRPFGQVPSEGIAPIAQAANVR
jgi:predicted RND superfamily exporter protein